MINFRPDRKSRDGTGKLPKFFCLYVGTEVFRFPLQRGVYDRVFIETQFIASLLLLIIYAYKKPVGEDGYPRLRCCNVSKPQLGNERKRAGAWRRADIYPYLLTLKENLFYHEQQILNFHQDKKISPPRYKPTKNLHLLKLLKFLRSV